MMGQRYTPTINTLGESIKKNRAIDILTLRHIFQPLESDFEKLFERKTRYLAALEKKLGSAEVFSLPTDEQKRLHNQAESLRWETDVLCALHDYFNHMIDCAIEINGILSAQYFEMKADRDQQKQYFENLCYVYHAETEIRGRELQKGLRNG